MELQLLKFAATARRLSMARGTLEARIKDGILPVPFRQGQNRCWLASEIDATAAAIAAGKSDDELKRLAKQLAGARQQHLDRALHAAIGAGKAML